MSEQPNKQSESTQVTVTSHNQQRGITAQNVQFGAPAPPNPEPRPRDWLDWLVALTTVVGTIVGIVFLVAEG